MPTLTLYSYIQVGLQLTHYRKRQLGNSFERFKAAKVTSLVYSFITIIGLGMFGILCGYKRV